MQTDFAANYSYHVIAGPGQLSMGIKAMVSYYTADLTELKIWEQNDVVFANDINDRWIPNFGAGLYYYTDRFYAGISVPHLLNYRKPSTFLSAEISKVPSYERHYYLMSGYVIETGGDIYLKPSFLVKYVADAPLNADINLNAFYKTYFSIGASYRTDKELVALFEMNITRRLRLGYAYDVPLSQLNKYSYGTHEIMMAVDLGQNIIKMKTPRFF